MVFDTLKSVEELQEAGIPEDQAKAQVRVFQRIIESDLATKRDIKELEQEMLQLKKELQQEMRELEYRLTIKTGLMLVASTGVILGTTAIPASSFSLILSPSGLSSTTIPIKGAFMKTFFLVSYPTATLSARLGLTIS